MIRRLSLEIFCKLLAVLPITPPQCANSLNGLPKQRSAEKRHEASHHCGDICYDLRGMRDDAVETVDHDAIKTADRWVLCVESCS